MLSIKDFDACAIVNNSLKDEEILEKGMVYIFFYLTKLDEYNFLFFFSMLVLAS